jgi:hypothetical protein
MVAITNGPCWKGQTTRIHSTNGVVWKATQNERAKRYKEQQRVIWHTMMETTIEKNVESSTINLSNLAINLEKSINIYA